jgi:hypothetical protein
MQNQPTFLEQVQNAQREQEQLSLAIFELTEQLDARKEQLKAVRAFLQGVNVGAGAKGEEHDAAKADQA